MPAPTCSTCNGRGYALHRGVGIAHAEPCRCTPSCACGGAGVVHVERNGTTYVQRCPCQRIQAAFTAWNAARVPAKYAHATLDTWDRSLRGAGPALDAVTAWADTYAGRGLVLHGMPGRGKSHLAAIAAQAAVFKLGLGSLAWGETAALFQALRTSFAAKDGEASVIQPFLQAGMVVIDDAGQGRGTDWERSVIDQIISFRYDSMRPIILTTQLLPVALPAPAGALAGEPAPNLVDRLGERIVSRLREMCVWVHVTGADQRGKL